MHSRINFSTYITMCMHSVAMPVSYIEALLPLSNGVVHWSLDAAV